METNKLYFLRTGCYLKRFKGFFKNKDDAEGKLKEILKLSSKENDKNEVKLVYNLENLEASVFLQHIDNVFLSDASEFMLEAPLTPIPNFLKNVPSF